MFKKPFSFEGRIRRTEFGITFIIYIVVYIILRIMLMADDSSVKIFGLLLYAPLLWFLWAQGSKRCHDLDKSGWWQLIPFYIFWMLFQSGTPGPNQFDPDYIEGMFYGADDYERPYIVDEPGPVYDVASTIAAAAITEEIIEDSFAPNNNWQDDQGMDDDNDYSSDDDQGDNF